MARIQKKKAAAKKRKKQDVAVSDSAIRQTDTGKSESAGQEAVVSKPAAGVDKKKKKVLAARKFSGSEQSAVMKLIEKYFGTWIQFFREVKVELLKVTWPSKKQTIGSTAVVILFVFIVALFLGAVDVLLSSLIRLIL